MHELALATSLLDMVEDYARREGFAKVAKLTLSWGRLSCIDPEAFKFLFEIQARDPCRRSRTGV
jgi:hydrogenase nickel incorporation protein HypA/HybF